MKCIDRIALMWKALLVTKVVFVYEMTLKDKKIRITVVGDGGIGKTSMLIAYKDKTFDDSQYIPTVWVYKVTVNAIKR